MNKFISISENQGKICKLREEGYTFTQIAEELGITEKIAMVNYHYAIQKYNGNIPNKNSKLSEAQKNDIVKALEAITNHLRELIKLEDNKLSKLSYNPASLIRICQDMSDMVGGTFDKNEFASLIEKQVNGW